MFPGSLEMEHCFNMDKKQKKTVPNHKSLGSVQSRTSSLKKQLGGLGSGGSPPQGSLGQSPRKFSK